MLKRLLKREAAKEPAHPIQQEWERAIEAALKERENPASSLNLFNLAFPQQTKFIADPAKRKGLWCTRRAAKSYTGGLYLCDVVEKFHEVNCLYLSLTKGSAMGIIWKDILQKIDRDYDLQMRFRESSRDVTSRTGSMIYISGADADAAEMQKLLGKKYKLIIIDEAQAFTVDMKTLVYGILGPTLIDQGGTMCILGTSGNLVQGLFFDVTNGTEPGWSVHNWTALDNPYVAKQWQLELDDIKANRPLFMETALFKQWYLNMWVIDEDAKVYKWQPLRNEAQYLPRDLADWHYVLVIDLAHSPDSTSFTVLCWHEQDPTLYVVQSHKHVKLDITEVGTRAKLLDAKYNFQVKVVDGANKQAVAELNNRHGLGLIPADKTGKADFIKIMNDDFIQARIKLLPDTEDLKAEYRKLIWVTDDNGKPKEPRIENPAIHNDCADGALYGWRYCYPYLFKGAVPAPDPHAQSTWEPLHIKALEDQVRRDKNPNELDLQWNQDWDDQDSEFE